MPVYTARCNSCGHIQDYFEKVSNCYNTPPCEKCASVTEKIITLASSPNVQTFEPYWDHHMASQPVYVESKKHKKELMKKNGVREKCDYFS